MSCTKSFTMFTIKTPSRLDKAIKSVPNIKEAKVTFGLPKWKSMPLDNKIPAFQSPDNSYPLSRRKLGQRLRVSLPRVNFNLSDPYNRELDCSYNALHDKHLAQFFSRPYNKKHLIKMGLINNKLDVLCSLKEYNIQRMYWRKMNGKIVLDELRRKDELDQEHIILNAAESLALKEASKKLMEEKRKERAEEIQKLNKESRLNTLLEIQDKKEQQYNRFLNAKRSKFLMQIKKGEENKAYIQRTQNLAKLFEKCRLLIILRNRMMKDRKRRVEKEKRVEDEKKKKIMIINNKWKAKEELQKKSIEKERKLLACAQMERERNINKYNEEIKRKREMDEKRYKNMKNVQKKFRRHRMKKSPLQKTKHDKSLPKRKVSVHTKQPKMEKKILVQKFVY